MNKYFYLKDENGNPFIEIDTENSNYKLDGIQSIHWTFDCQNSLPNLIINSCLSSVDIAGKAEIMFFKKLNKDTYKLYKTENKEVFIHYDRSDNNVCKVTSNNEVISNINSITISANAVDAPQKWKIKIFVIDYE